MRAIGAAIMASALIFTGTVASAADMAPLAPGKPAGIKKAQDVDTSMLLWIVGGGLVVGGIALAASQGSSKAPTPATTPPTTTTTTTTGTSP